MSDLTDWLASVQQTESNGRDYDANGAPLTSPAGAQYAMQVMPATAQDPGYGVTPAKDSSPEEADRVGREYYAALVNKYGDPITAAAAYNAGPGKVDDALSKTGGDIAQALPMLPKETQQYVQKVQANLPQPQTG